MMSSKNILWRPLVTTAVLLAAGCRTGNRMLTEPAAGRQAPAGRPVPAHGPVQASGKPEDRYLTTAEVRAKLEWERERGIHFPRLARGNPRLKQIALTFDDGPHPAYTARLLDILKRENVIATFFVVGKMAERYPELVRRQAAEGHEVANHTYNHVRLPTLPPAGIERELRDGARAIKRVIGFPTRLYRPPGGEYDGEVILVSKQLQYVMVLWTDDPGDYANPGEERIEAITRRRVSYGGIILLHDGVQETLDILPELIAGLKKKGYAFVTCSDMAIERGVIKVGGPRVTPKRLPVGQRTLQHLAPGPIP